MKAHVILLTFTIDDWPSFILIEIGAKEKGWGKEITWNKSHRRAYPYLPPCAFTSAPFSSNMPTMASCPITDAA
jgi:hypothetical protein